MRHSMQFAAGENSDTIACRFRSKSLFEEIDGTLQKLMTDKFGPYKMFNTELQKIDDIARIIISDIQKLATIKNN